jgi:hydroxybutyrate-dimer hydrolase
VTTHSSRSGDSRRLDQYLAANPHRIATKHAHSQLNPERLWGQFALSGIEFAFWALNDHFDRKGKTRFDRKNTIVIAAGASNGGGMALRALEDDGKGLIDGLVVTEPNIGPEDGRFVIRFGDDPPFDPAGRSIYDSMTLMSVYAPCAAFRTLAGAPPTAASPAESVAVAEGKGAGFRPTTQAQAASALAVIRAHGYASAQDWGIASHEWLSLWRSLQITYANAYGRFAIQDNICGVSFAAVGATLQPAPITEANAKKLFADSSGIPTTGGVNLIADWAQGGPILENFALSRSTGLGDLNLDSALCFRSLQTGEGLSDGQAWANYARVRAGTREIQTTGRLHGKPAIVIHGRRDALVFPNLQSRAYYGLNQQHEGSKSRLSYIEVTTGQHFDTFISSLFVSPTAGAQFAPLHYYFVKAMDSMYAHLTTGAALPPSQVVRPTPRGAVPYTSANVPGLLPLPSLTPAAGDRIIFGDGVLSIPE